MLQSLDPSLGRNREKLLDEIMQMSQERKGAGLKNNIISSNQIKRSVGKDSYSISRMDGSDPMGGSFAKKRDLKRLQKKDRDGLSQTYEDDKTGLKNQMK